MDDALAETFLSNLRERQARILQGDTVRVDRYSIGIQHQYGLSNGIGRTAKFLFRIADIVESLGERLMRSLEFDGEVRDTSGRLRQREVCIRGGAGLTRIDCERPEHSLVLAYNGLSPRPA